MELDKTVEQVNVTSESMIYYNEIICPAKTDEEQEKRHYREIRSLIDRHIDQKRKNFSEEKFHKQFLHYFDSYGSKSVLGTDKPRDFILYKIRNNNKPIESLEDFDRLEQARLASLQDHAKEE